MFAQTVGAEHFSRLTPLEEVEWYSTLRQVCSMYRTWGTYVF